MSFLTTMSVRMPAFAIALSALLAVSAQAQTPARTAVPLTGEAAQVKKLLEQKFQGATVTIVNKSPYFGLYEAMFDEQLVYTDAKVTYVLVGNVYDAATRKNLTEAKMRELTRVAFDSLPLELALKKVKGDGSQARDLLRRRLSVLRAARKRAQDHRQRDDLHLPLSDRSAAPGFREKVADHLVRAGQCEGLGRILRYRRLAR